MARSNGCRFTPRIDAVRFLGVGLVVRGALRSLATESERRATGVRSS